MEAFLVAMELAELNGNGLLDLTTTNDCVNPQDGGLGFIAGDVLGNGSSGDRSPTSQT